MAREDMHFRLRLPEDLKAKISEAAEANRRSMTAEIVARLEESFDPAVQEMLHKSGLAHGLLEGAMQTVSSRLKSIEERVRDQNPGSVFSVYIVIDSNGYPQSWDEMHEHLRAIYRNARISPVEIRVEVISPPLESSSNRQEEADALHRFYKRKDAAMRKIEAARSAGVLIEAKKPVADAKPVSKRRIIDIDDDKF